MTLVEIDFWILVLMSSDNGVRQPDADCLAVGSMSMPCHSPMDTKPGRREIL